MSLWQKESGRLNFAEMSARNLEISLPPLVWSNRARRPPTGPAGQRLHAIGCEIYSVHFLHFHLDQLQRLF